MSQELTVPEGWLAKVAIATGMEREPLLTMVNNMWNRGASKAEIEQAMIFLAQANGKTLLFVNSKGKN